MTEEDLVNQLVDEIDNTLHGILDHITQHLSTEIDNAVREHLSENFRFWRRPVLDKTLEEISSSIMGLLEGKE